MAISEKIKAMLKLQNKKSYELAEYLNMTPQALHNKFNRGSFSAEDLIKISIFLDSELAVTLSSNQKISFDISDIRG